MTDFKLVVSDKEGKSYQKELKSPQSDFLIGKNIGEAISGDLVGLQGFELKITGGSDNCGFPMRHGILGVRKKITLYGGVGFSGGLPGERRRKTVCGHKINETITQVNLKVVKGSQKLADFFEQKAPA
ncbi:MAG TPA: 30S ribosomal protein S6e [Candidatus Nanoarchaeia archaeon]|nr:30S ribosomal protein S6e [Candidatus Nanoarchaeia archaeon]